MIWLPNLNVMLLVIRVLTLIQIIAVHVGVQVQKKVIKTISCKRQIKDLPAKLVVMINILPMGLSKTRAPSKCITNARIVT